MPTSPTSLTPHSYQLVGEVSQAVIVRLSHRERAWASRGSLVSIEGAIRWHLEVPGGSGAAVGRMLAGEGLSLTRIQADGAGGTVVLSAGRPGKITPWSLEERGPVVCTRGSFLAALGDVRIEPTVARKAGAAFFGGAGVFLQKISGRGTVFVHGAGDFVQHELVGEGTIQVSTGNLAAFSEALEYNVVGVQGCRNILFGGEGLFMAHLRGTGTVLTQTLKRAELSSGRK